MKKTTLIPLSQFLSDVTPEERRTIENEKKYYQFVVSLRKQRGKLGLTQAKLAQLSNLPRTTITRVESGTRNATLQTLMSMAEAMGKQFELRLR